MEKKEFGERNDKPRDRNDETVSDSETVSPGMNSTAGRKPDERKGTVSDERKEEGAVGGVRDVSTDRRRDRAGTQDKGKIERGYTAF